MTSSTSLHQLRAIFFIFISPTHFIPATPLPSPPSPSHVHVAAARHKSPISYRDQRQHKQRRRHTSRRGTRAVAVATADRPSRDVEATDIPPYLATNYYHYSHLRLPNSFIRYPRWHSTSCIYLDTPARPWTIIWTEERGPARADDE